MKYLDWASLYVLSSKNSSAPHVKKAFTVARFISANTVVEILLLASS